MSYTYSPRSSSIDDTNYWRLESHSLTLQNYNWWFDEVFNFGEDQKLSKLFHISKLDSDELDPWRVMTRPIVLEDLFEMTLFDFFSKLDWNVTDLRPTFSFLTIFLMCWDDICDRKYYSSSDPYSRIDVSLYLKWLKMFSLQRSWCKRFSTMFLMRINWLWYDFLMLFM